MVFEMVKVAVKALDNKKAEDIRVLKIDDITSLADYFVICTGTSNTHIKALADECEYQLGQAGYDILHREGRDSGEKILLFMCIINRRENFMTWSIFGKMAHKLILLRFWGMKNKWDMIIKK